MSLWANIFVGNCLRGKCPVGKCLYGQILSGQMLPWANVRVFNDLINDFTKSHFKSFWDDFDIFKITLKYGDLI
jgi:hypothetical protein